MRGNRSTNFFGNRRLWFGCRVGAVCAILAGASRAALIIAPGMGLSPPALETIYLAIDLAIQLALLALLTRLGNRLGLWGVAGVIMAITGLLVIRTGERSLFGAAAYPSGAGLLAIGMAVTTFPLTHQWRERISRTPRPSFRLSSVRSVTPSE
jgi:hypothetical protein